ncbi:N-acetyltaurine hydrolase-like isoform X2 [Amphiura filiformis]|uniref:N-acetyltaurine hydrolase-like isoform X2 n=1 Tax=Amphiura filiformis TaxID=82378 RepID=UPI003B215CDE
MAAAAVDELSGKIQTVLGPINACDLGQTLTHEHFQIDNTIWATGFQKSTPDWIRKKWNNPLDIANLWWIHQYPYSNKENLFLLDEMDAWKEELNFYHQHGGRSIVDVTNRGIGRDVKVLVELSKATGVNLISGGGWYVGSTHPPELSTMKQESLVDLMVEEITQGADGSDAKCGVIGEIGCTWPLQDTERKVLQASAVTQEQLGCPVIIHPGRNKDAPAEILRVLQEAGGDISKTVMSHMDRCVTTTEELLEFAKLGSYVEFDLFGWEISYYQLAREVDFLSDAQRINFFKDLVDEGYEDKMVMAHDIHRKCQLMKYGGHGYSHILLNVIPKMLLKGITQAQIDKITTHNPQKWLTFK